MNGTEFECMCRGELRAVEVNGTVEECVEVPEITSTTMEPTKPTPATTTSFSTTAEVSTSHESSTPASTETPSHNATDEVVETEEDDESSTTTPPTPVQAANDDVFVSFSVELPLTVEEFNESSQLSFLQGCSQPRHDPSAE